MNSSFRRPVLAKCSNRSVTAQINQQAGQPESWIDLEFSPYRDLGSVTFDFFVDWESNEIGSEVWRKVLVNENTPWPTDYVYWCVGELSKLFGYKNLYYHTEFSNFYDFDLHYLIFKDNTDWESEGGESIVDLHIEKYGSSVNVIGLKDVTGRIETQRGKHVPMDSDGLIYANTSLECYLSSNDYFWPGDADRVIYDFKNGNVLNIIEFKKHNLNSNIEDQTLMNWRKRDKLKYESLGLLRNRLESDRITMVFYPTGSEFENIKIEEIGGSFDDLRVESSAVLPLPTDDETRQQFTEAMVSGL